MTTIKFARGFLFGLKLGGGLLFLLVPWLAVHAQPSRVHEQTFDWHVMRSSILSAATLSASRAHAYGVNRATDVAVLRVVVMRRSGRPPGAVPAKVQAVSLDSARQRQRIDMRESKSGDENVYFGSFRFLPGELRTFIIHAEPLGSDEVLEMAYDEALWRRGEVGKSGQVDRRGAPLTVGNRVERTSRAGRETE